MEKGQIYIFTIKVYEAPLSEKLKKFLSDEYGVSIKKIYKSELDSLEKME